MKQAYLDKAIFITLILISIQATNQVNEFTVEKLELEERYYCYASRIEFDILGKFNSSTGLLDSINFYVTSNGNKYETECNPSSLNSKLFCKIKLRYPVNNSDIFLPLTPPEDKKYVFKNWENIFGSKPGESNKLANLTCKITVGNIFTPNSITIGECLKKSNSRDIIINGEWENKKVNLSRGSYSISFDNENGDFINCNYQTYNEFKCNFNVEGTIKIKEQYFEVKTLLGYTIYKINKFDSSETVSNCSNNIANSDGKDDNNNGDDDDFDFDFDEDDFREALSADSLQLLNKILILFSLLLF